MKISWLSATPFPPFGDLTIDFPHTGEVASANLAEIHVFTGPNGSGKTRLLSLIAASLGSKKELEKRGFSSWSFDKFEGALVSENDPSKDIRKDLKNSILTGEWRDINAMTFCPRAYLESAEVKANAEVRTPSMDDALSFSRPSDESQRLLQGIFTMDLQAATESRNGKDGRYSRMITSVQEAIQEVTGRKFSFASSVHPKPELQVYWGDSSDPLPITTLPDGLRSILGWLVQGVVWMDVFWRESPEPLNEPVILLVDEPESHLHPEWQWRVMPMMQRLFPKAQIFVATHSPFVVSSLNENAWIHRLKVGENGAVTIEEARKAEKGDSYVTALYSILDVKDRFDPENRELIAKFRELRDAALKGDSDQEMKMNTLAGQIAERGMELEHVMAAELRQYERQKLQIVESKSNNS